MLILKQNVTSGVPTPAAGKYTLFINEFGDLTVKDQTGATSEVAIIPTGDTRVLFNDGGAMGSSANLTFAKTTNTLTLTGDLDVSGDVTIGGNITIGNQTLDSITVVADFTSDLIPNASNSFNIGSDSKRWNRIFAETFDTGEILVRDNIVRTVNSNADLELDAAGTGQVSVIGSLKVNGTSFTNTDISNWNTAHGWGDHGVENYITLTDLSVGANDPASGNGGIAYTNITGVFTYTPPDLSSYLTTETDPVVGAITGIVKADGGGNISAAVAGTDYVASETDPVVGAITGIVKADGGGNISAAVAGTDYLTPTLNGTSEVVVNLSGATGTVVHNFSSGAVFYHTSMAADFTANFTNLPTTDDRTISVVLILNQGTPAYIPTAVQIAGSGQTINWLGAGGAPSGNAAQIDIVGFTFLRSGGSWTVIGSLNTYG